MEQYYFNLLLDCYELQEQILLREYDQNRLKTYSSRKKPTSSINGKESQPRIKDSIFLYF